MEVKPRDKSVKARDLLKQNFIPIEYYGKGIENQSFQVDYQAFRKAYQKSGANTIVDLSVGEGQEPLSVLIHEVKYDPITDMVVHIDAINVVMGQEIHTKLPLEFVGTSPAVKDLSGTLMTHVNEIDVKCMPRDLIYSVQVDISSLADFHEYIRIKDLNLPSTITVLNELEDVVVTVVAPKIEEEPVAEEVSAETVEGSAEEGAKEGQGEDGQPEGEGGKE